MVVCDRAANERYETHPSLAVEVLSPSSESIDRREKAESYATIESLHTYALMNPAFRRIEIATRDTAGHWAWKALGPGEVWQSTFGDIDVDALYDAIDSEATT